MATRLLICADWFDPGVRAGGPIQSCVNLTLLLGKSERIAVITSSRDLGCTTPYSGLVSDKWVNWRGYARVRYCSTSLQRMIIFPFTIRRFLPDTIYLNSMFSFAGTLWPLIWIFLTRCQARIILAPRGMLKQSALARKKWKKWPFLFLLRYAGLTRRVRFHATSNDEVEDIRRVFGNVAISKIPNVPKEPLSNLPSHTKHPGVVRCCFVGRIHPIKNLLWLLEVLADVKGHVRMTVVGPAEDQDYFLACQRAVSKLPTNINVDFVGPVAEKEVREQLSAADALVLPTEGENFGHAIFEALSVGTPVVITDRTIWRDLVAQSAGWDLEFGNRDVFRFVLENLSRMNDNQHHSLRCGAFELAHTFFSVNRFAEKFKELFS